MKLNVKTNLAARPNHGQRLALHLLSLSLLLILLGTNLTVLAQNPAPTIDFLEVELWPDYDRPSVLVLLTGTLSNDTGFPATVMLPLPENAEVNAVARVDVDGSMYTDLEFDDSTPGQLAITTSAPTFRVEYYAPYEADGNQRDYTFEWQSDIPVNEFVTTIQQPSLASEINLSPEAVQVDNRTDGLQYHTLPVQQVPAGEKYSLETSYNLLRPQLSAELLAAPQPAIPSDIDPAAGQQETDFNWQIVIAVAAFALALAAGAWLLLGYRQSKRRKLKPRPVRQSTSKRSASSASQGSAGKANFCHECGQALVSGDKFCRNCGTAIKSV